MTLNIPKSFINDTPTWLYQESYKPAQHCVNWCQGQIDNLFRYFSHQQQQLLWLIAFVLIAGFILSSILHFVRDDEKKELLSRVYVYLNDFATYLTIALLVWFIWFS